METLRTVASIAGPIIGLVSLVAALITYRGTRKNKALTYKIAPTLSLVQVGSAIKNRVKVDYDGEQIENLSGVSVEICSSGTEPVELNLGTDAHALETPVTLDFGPEARILGEPSVDSKPENLTVSAMKDPENTTRVVLDKFLLNPGQSVTVSVFADDLRNSPKVYANIKGAPLRETTRDGRRRWVSGGTIVLLVMLGFVGLALGFTRMQTPVYEASATMMVIQEQEQQEASGISQIQQLPPAIPDTVRRAPQLINSRPVAEETIQRLGLRMEHRTVLDNLTVVQVANTFFIELFYRDADPRRAQQILDTVSEVSSERISSQVSPPSAAYDIRAKMWKDATVPSTPVSLDPVRNAVVAAGLGVMVGIGLALLMQRKAT